MMMQISRRNFLLAGAALGAGAAFGLFPRTANANNYWLVSACSNKNNEHFIAALDMQGQLRCQVKLPARGHDVIALANKPGHVIAFARRPGTFAMEVDLLKGEVVNEIHALADSHFYGHGTFSAKHNVLITSENRFATGEGRIVLRDARDYSLLESYPSGGIGPHQIALMPGEDSLVIANGGIRTHPDQPRKKPTICHSASSPRQPGITGSPIKWQLKNHRSGWISSSAMISPLPNSPPSPLISTMRSIISILPTGRRALPGPNISPWPHCSSSSRLKEDGLVIRNCFPVSFVIKNCADYTGLRRYRHGLRCNNGENIA